MPATPSGRVMRYFETLTLAALDGIDEIYAPEARFKDPFNDVQGVSAIRHVYAHMFDTLDAPGFVVLDSISADGRCCLIWQLRFNQRGSGRLRVVHGASHLRFAPDGRIEMHRDYWDPAEELYEQVPVLGGLMRAIKRRLAAGRLARAATTQGG